MQLFIRLLIAVALSLETGAGSPAGPPAFDPTGLWEGAIIVRPGEYEIDLQLTLSRCEHGGLCGRLALPTEERETLTLQDPEVQGKVVSFHTQDQEGTVSVFQGTFAPDGRASMEGGSAPDAC
jgi:hypothetical protein